MLPDYNRLLDHASTLWGIEPEYWDIWGRKHTASPETRQSILKDLGVPIDTAEQLAEAIENRVNSEWLRLLPPCLVIEQSRRPREVAISLPEPLQGRTLVMRIQREDEIVETHEVPLGGLAVMDSRTINGCRYVRKYAPLPLELPLGYYDVGATIEPDSFCVMRLIITPERAYAGPGNGRSAGIAIQLYSVRSARNWGCGDFTDLRGVLEWAAAEAGASFVALNPLHAIHNRRPFNISPYLPNCIFYQNFLYLDVEAVEDFQRSRRARDFIAQPQVRAEIEALRQSEYVEYERVHALKLRALKLAFTTFLREYRRGSPRALEFFEYAAKEGDLLDRFATYCALDEYLHARNPDVWVWTQWPEAYQRPDSEQTSAFQKQRWRSVMFYKYLQWQIDLQLAAAQKYAREKNLSIGLYHDLALATDRYGSDFWAHRDFYVDGCRVGSPPDDFSPKGQDWAFPPPNSDRHRDTGYRLFSESIRKNCRHGGALRIDHVMRFFRLYWIPRGSDATQGAYVRDRYDDLVRILALESVRNQVIVIGEDLGTVEPHVRETLTRFGILSYRLFYFERNERGEFRRAHEYPEQALVSCTTHDLPTLAGFWVGHDIEARRSAGLLLDERSYRAQWEVRAREKQKMLDVLLQSGLLPPDCPRQAAQIPELTGALHNAIIGFLSSTPARLLVINQEDLTKELAQQNLPATTWEYPNWSRKMKFTVDQLRREGEARNFSHMFRHWIARTGRHSTFS